jgi:hypothetical protein
MRSRTRLALFCAAVATWSSSSAAHADRAEAQWSARSLVGAAAMSQERAPHLALGAIGGVALAFNYGISNRLDLGAEVLALVTSTPTFDHASLMISDDIVYAGYTRREGATLFMLGPTWRYGVAWVPVVGASVGGGVRYRAVGSFSKAHYHPKEDFAVNVMDLAASGKVGIEHRMGKSLTVGAYSTLLVEWSPDAPMLPSLSLTLGISWVHYPNLF